MPNGDLHFNYVEMDEFFSPISDTIITFGADHGLHHSKYYHDFPSWDLCFTHPKGGQAKVSICRSDDDSVSVECVWWFDDYEKFQRNLWRSKSYPTKRVASVLYHDLEVAFYEVLRLGLGNWTEVATGYEEIWGRYSREQFRDMAPKWPTAKLPN